MRPEELGEEITIELELQEPPLPALLDDSLASALAPFRKFGHVVHHDYGFQLEWNRMAEGIAGVEDVFLRFKSRLLDYLQTLES